MLLVSAVCCRLVCYCPSPSHPTTLLWSMLLVSAVCCRLVFLFPAHPIPSHHPLLDFFILPLPCARLMRFCCTRMMRFQCAQMSLFNVRRWAGNQFKLSNKDWTRGYWAIDTRLRQAYDNYIDRSGFHLSYGNQVGCFQTFSWLVFICCINLRTCFQWFIYDI